MSFPWKKSRSTKISKFVNDHLQHSQKRRDGSTFVVETGFPTSLIDLFIKNRDNLKKPAKKKRVSRNLNKSPIVNVVVNDVVNDVVSDDYDDCSSGINQVILGSPTPYPSPVSSPLVNEEEERFVEKVEKVEEKGVVDSNGYFLILLKLFLIVVLALGTKRLTVGITLSAFLLVLLESLGNRASLVLKSCPDVNWVLKLFRNKLDQENGILKSELRLPIQENRVGEIVCEENEVMDGIESEVVLRESRRDKIKSKMNKFVQKKLRNSIRVQNQVFSSEEKELEKSGNLSSISSGSCGEEDSMNAVSCFDVTPKANEEDIKVKDSGVIWPALVLFLIVLIGLIGGRVFAFLLTLLWFSLLKLSEKLRKYR